VAVQVYGVDQTYVQSFLPQVAVDDDAPLTSTRLTQIISAAAAEFNGLARRAGIDPATDIAADTTTDLYANAQRLVFELARPWILSAAHGTIVVAAEVEVIRQRALDTMLAFAARPQALGEVPATATPRFRSSTHALGLDTTEYHRANRRQFDGARGRTSDPDDIYRN